MKQPNHAPDIEVSATRKCSGNAFTRSNLIETERPLSIDTCRFQQGQRCSSGNNRLIKNTPCRWISQAKTSLWPVSARTDQR